MIATGTVMKVRDSSYVNQRTKEQVSMLYIDLFDVTVGLAQLSCRLGDVAFRPEVKQEISVEIVGARKAAFGDGVNFSIRNLQLVNGGGSGKPPLPSGK